MKKLDKNVFALKLMVVLNEEYFSHQHGCCEIDTTNDGNNEPMYNKHGEIMFVGGDEDIFPASELFLWLNVIMHDRDTADEEEITDELRIWHGKAIDAGYITKETKKFW